MSLQDISWNQNAFDSEDQIENCRYLDKKPFKIFNDSSSEDLVESELYENPFKDNTNSILKDSRVVFKNREKNNRTIWNDKMQKLTSNPKIIRSAPEKSNNHWSDCNNGESITLPIIGAGKSDSIKRISPETVVELLISNIKRKFLIVDARYEYEYNGGHIINAVNISNDENLGKLFDLPQIIIFHCEYSSIRGPNLAQKLRNMDRQNNKYPNLSIPEIYVMEEGYKGFFYKFPEYCIPCSYVKMHDKRYIDEYSCDRKIKKSKTNKFY